MLISICIATLCGIIGYQIFSRFKIPGLVGLLIVGILLGQSGLNLLDKDLLAHATDFQKIALVIIVMRAAFSIEKTTFFSNKRQILLLATLPFIIEVIGLAFLMNFSFQFSVVEAVMLGLIVVGVSPAIVFPQMIKLQLKKVEPYASIILTAAALEATLVLVLFSNVQEAVVTKANFLNSMLSVILAIGCGAIIGGIFYYLLKGANRLMKFSNVQLLIVILFGMVLLSKIEKLGTTHQFFSVLIAILVFGQIFKIKELPEQVQAIRMSLNGLWVYFEAMLFVLIGAQVNLQNMFENIGICFVVLVSAFLFRALGIFLSTRTNKLTRQEKIYSFYSFIPKGTIQATIGSIPLALGLPNGQLILSIAVFSIIVSAPLGSILMKSSEHKLVINQ